MDGTLFIVTAIMVLFSVLLVGLLMTDPERRIEGDWVMSTMAVTIWGFTISALTIVGLIMGMWFLSIR